MIIFSLLIFFIFKLVMTKQIKLRCPFFYKKCPHFLNWGFHPFLRCKFFLNFRIGYKCFCNLLHIFFYSIYWISQSIKNSKHRMIVSAWNYIDFYFFPVMRIESYILFIELTENVFDHIEIVGIVVVWWKISL